MLGWEFPPHQSGGLGTACRGLAEALARAGSDVRFVVPRAFGDEPRGRVELVGCDRWLGARGPALAKLAVGSALLPYEGAQAYAARGALPGSLCAAPRAAHSGREARARGELAGPPAAREAEPAPFAGGYGASLAEEVLRYAEVVRALALERPFDVVHAHDWMTWPAALAVRAATHKPFVCHVHATEIDRSGAWPDARIRALEQQGFDGADRIVCVSHFTAAQIARHYRVDASKLRVVHNAVAQRVAVRRARERGRPREPLVLFLGRVTSQKGPERFLEAAARVARHLPAARFVLGGAGDLWPAMIERAAALGLARRVFFTGYLDEEQVVRLYAAADLYVMPSVSEPFGIAPLEAMCQDVPVIVPRESGVAEVLEHALKVDAADVEELAQAMLAVLTRPALARQLVLAGRRELRALRWEFRARSLLDVYAELAA